MLLYIEVHSLVCKIQYLAIYLFRRCTSNEIIL